MYFYKVTTKDTYCFETRPWFLKLYSFDDFKPSINYLKETQNNVRPFFLLQMWLDDFCFMNIQDN